MTESLFPGYSAIVLAGGRSRRMGVDKASALVGGRRVLDRVLSVVTGLFGDVVVVGRTGWGEARGPVRFLDDETPGLGPLAGLYTGLGVVKHGRALAVGCDMPFISRGVLEELVAHDGGADATVARTASRPQPLLAVYDPGIRPVIGRLLESDDRSLMHLLSTIRVTYVDLTAAEASFSVNTPEDMQRAEELFCQGSGE